MAKKQEKAGSERSVPSVAEVVAFCQKLSLTAEQVGRWVWVSFAEKPDEAMRQALRDFGFRWSYRRKKWAHNCGHPTRSARQSNPWEKYDHKFVSNGRGCLMVQTVVFAVLAVWGSVLAALIGWIIYSVIGDMMATLCPRRFRKHNHRICLRKFRRRCRR